MDRAWKYLLNLLPTLCWPQFIHRPPLNARLAVHRVRGNRFHDLFDWCVLGLSVWASSLFLMFVLFTVFRKCWGHLVLAWAGLRNLHRNLNSWLWKDNLCSLSYHACFLQYSSMLACFPSSGERPCSSIFPSHYILLFLNDSSSKSIPCFYSK